MALAEEVAEKKTEKRWAYGTGLGYNNGYSGLGNSVYSGYNQPYNQLGTQIIAHSAEKKIRFNVRLEYCVCVCVISTYRQSLRSIFGLYFNRIVL